MAKQVLSPKEKNEPVVAKKRGRKSKKEIEEAKKNNELNESQSENIVVNIEETTLDNELTNSEYILNNNKTNSEYILNNNNIADNNNDSTENEENDENEENENTVVSKVSDQNKPIIKKRGRKPKGGKIIQQIIPLSDIKEPKPNVILHLKCSIKDLKDNNLFGNILEGYSFSNPNNLQYDVIIGNKLSQSNEYLNSQMNFTDNIQDNDNDNYYDNDNDYDLSKNKDNDIREIWKKLKVLEHNLHVNNTDNKKSACFWDTCEFDNPPVYIPKHHINGTYQVYGCFCSPECAVAHLMEENIDSSVKFERYQLMNHVYSKIYDYKKNIKPAANPYYMLDKFYGNLTIQQYRSLLRNERLFLVVDKPLTRVMPELHEDNDDFIINNKIIPTNNIKMKKLQRKQTKTNILSERFGLAT